MKIAVLFGGDSMERDVSVASAAQVVAALRSRGHTVVAVDAHRGLLSSADERLVLSKGIDRAPPAGETARGLPALVDASDLRDVELVFLALHGGSGEDGTIQSVLDLARVPYTGSGRLGSAIAWDKDIAKRLFVAAGVPTPEWLMAPAAPERIVEAIGLPAIVKPNGQGSTVGLTLVDASEDLEAAIELAGKYDSEVMIERYIPGRELTVGILEDTPLAVGEIVPATGEIFDYVAKYQAGGADEIFPAPIGPDLTARAQALALKAHRALKLEEYSRVDFRLDAGGGLWCLEVNTLPGLSSSSLLPRAAEAVGIDFGELCERICIAALAKARRTR